MKSQRVTLIIFSLGLLLLFSIRSEDKNSSQHKQLLERLTLDVISERLRSVFQELWARRESDIFQTWDEINEQCQDQESLIEYLGNRYKNMISGKFSGGAFGLPWDFTLAAIDYRDKTFIYHPTHRKGFRIEDGSYLHEILKQRTGEYFWPNHLISEQLVRFFNDRPSENNRFTKVFFKEFKKCSAIVIFECHINIIDKLPPIQ